MRWDRVFQRRRCSLFHKGFSSSSSVVGALVSILIESSRKFESNESWSVAVLIFDSFALIPLFLTNMVNYPHQNWTTLSTPPSHAICWLDFIIFGHFWWLDMLIPFFLGNEMLWSNRCYDNFKKFWFLLLFKTHHNWLLFLKNVVKKYLVVLTLF